MPSDRRLQCWSRRSPVPVIESSSDALNLLRNPDKATPVDSPCSRLAGSAEALEESLRVAVQAKPFPWTAVKRVAASDTGSSHLRNQPRRSACGRTESKKPPDEVACFNMRQNQAATNSQPPGNRPFLADGTEWNRIGGHDKDCGMDPNVEPRRLVSRLSDVSGISQLRKRHNNGGIHSLI